MIITSEKCYLQKECSKAKKDTNGKYIKCELGYCPRLHRLDCLYNYSLLPMKQRTHIGLRADEEDMEAFNRLKHIMNCSERFVNEGHNLYIYSNCTGNGKTSWAIKILQSYLNSIWYKADFDTCQALFINVPDLLISLKDFDNENSYANKVLKNIKTAKLVIWDEIGSKAGTEYEQERLYSLINSRVMQGLTNIYTSNIVPNNLSNYIGQRLYSRVINDSICIEIKGGDKRGI